MIDDERMIYQPCNESMERECPVRPILVQKTYEIVASQCSGRNSFPSRIQHPHMQM